MSVSAVSSSRLPLQAALSRGYAAKAAQAVSAGSNPQEVKVSTLDNGLKLASLPTPTPGLATVGILVRAGARYETYETQGAAHALQMAAGLASKNHSFFGLTKNLQQTGSILQCQQGREYVMYGASFTQDKLDDGVDYLIEAATNPAFKTWELSDQMYRMDVAKQGLTQCDQSVELLHKAAFREGLGNSVYAPDFMLGKYKAPLVQAYFNKHVTSHRTAIVGVGVDQAQLVKYANLIKLESGQGSAAKATYSGGEQRLDLGGSAVTVCLAGQTAGFNNMKEAVAAWALECVLGEARVKYGAPSSKVAKALADVSGDVSFAKGVCFPYSDAGLTGVQMRVSAAAAGKAVNALAAALRSISISEAELTGAKKAMALGSMDMGPVGMAAMIGEQVLLNGEAVQPAQLAAAINAVSLGEVQAVAKKAFGGKLSLSAVGNLSTVPYLDTL